MPFLFFFVVQAPPPTHFPPTLPSLLSTSTPTPFLSSSYLTRLLSALCEWDMVRAAPWHYKARGADRIGRVAGEASGGSQWRCDAELQGSFTWKWINVTLPRLSESPHRGTAGAVYLYGKKGSQGSLQFLRTGFFLHKHKIPLVKSGVIGYGPADHSGEVGGRQVSCIYIKEHTRYLATREGLCVRMTNSGSLMAYRLLRRGQTQHKACGTIWTPSILLLPSSAKHSHMCSHSKWSVE